MEEHHDGSAARARWRELLGPNLAEEFRDPTAEGVDVVVRLAPTRDSELVSRRLARARSIARDRRGEVEVLLEDLEPEPRTVHALFGKQKSAVPKVRAFVDFLVELFARTPGRGPARKRR